MNFQAGEFKHAACVLHELLSRLLVVLKRQCTTPPELSWLLQTLQLQISQSPLHFLPCSPAGLLPVLTSHQPQKPIHTSAVGCHPNGCLSCRKIVCEISAHGVLTLNVASLTSLLYECSRHTGGCFHAQLVVL